MGTCMLWVHEHAPWLRYHTVPPQVREGLHYNPYFPGGAIAMPKMLSDGGVEYDDGTPATEAQQAKVGKRAQWGRRGEKEWGVVLQLRSGQGCPTRTPWSFVPTSAREPRSRVCAHAGLLCCRSYRCRMWSPSSPGPLSRRWTSAS